MAEKKTVTEIKSEAEVKAENVLSKSKKPLLVIGGVIIAGLLGWIGYTQFVVKPKAQKADDAIAAAAVAFEAQNWKATLDGDSLGNKGALYVIKNFGGTDAANLASIYAGISSLKLEKYEDAIKYLKDFNTSSKPMQARAYSNLGDAYGETKKFGEAVTAYKKAASALPEDESFASENLNRAALAAEMNNNIDEAVSLYKEILAKYPKTTVGYQADKNLNRIQVQPNDFK